MSYVIGVDIGGSHITAALVDLNARSVVAGSGIRKLVDSQAGAEEILASWCEVINRVSEGLPVLNKKIGIAMPGPFDYEEGICLIKDQNKFQALYNLNLKYALAARLGIESGDIRFMNDASCFLQGEVFGGAAKNFTNVLGLTLGTGLGSAVCKNGKAVDADLWKSPFGNGIAEDYLSTRWFVDRYRQLTGKQISGVKELVEAKDEGDIQKQIFLAFSENLAHFLLTQIRKFGSEVVVFGGNISNAFSFFQPMVQERLTRRNVNVVVAKALLNEDATLLGAASGWSADGETEEVRQTRMLGRA